MTYLQVHKWLRKRLGNPNAYPCVGCRKPARHWSLDAPAGSEHVMMELCGALAGLLFSTRSDDYSPRCPKCHVLYDRNMRQRPAGERT